MLSELTRRDDLLSAASVELIRKDLLPAVADARTHTQRMFGLVADTLSPAKEAVMRLDTDKMVIVKVAGTKLLSCLPVRRR